MEMKLQEQNVEKIRNKPSEDFLKSEKIMPRGTPEYAKLSKIEFK